MARREQARDTELASLPAGPGGLRPWDTDTEKKGGSVASRVAHDPCNLTIAYLTILGHLVLKAILSSSLPDVRAFI